MVKYAKVGHHYFAGGDERVSPFLVSEFAERIPKKGMPLQGIIKEIHLLRKTKKRS